MNKYIERFVTSEPRTSYLRLKKYSDNDWRLVYGTCKKKGYEIAEDVLSFFNTEDKEIDKAESERCSLSRAKREIIEISRCNDFKYFVTITISSAHCDRFHLEECQNLLHNNLKEYHRRCKRHNLDFKYLIVTEKHEKGGFHFHGLFTTLIDSDIVINQNDYSTSKFFDERLGFFSFSPIKSKKKCAFYISKYITKSPIKNETNQLYFCSKGLARAEVFDLPQSAGDLNLLKEFWGYENDYCKVRDFDFSHIPKNIQLFLLNKEEK